MNRAITVHDGRGTTSQRKPLPTELRTLRPGSGPGVLFTTLRGCHGPTRSPGQSPVARGIVAVLLLVAVGGALAVPLYARSLPKLGAFPFFYWYQLLWVPAVAIACWLSYLLLKTRPAARRPAMVRGPRDESRNAVSFAILAGEFLVVT